MDLEAEKWVESKEEKSSGQNEISKKIDYTKNY